MASGLGDERADAKDLSFQNVKQGKLARDGALGQIARVGCRVLLLLIFWIGQP